MAKIRLSECEIKGGFWGPKVDMVRNQVLRYQWQVLNDEIKDAEPSHCIENFRIAAGELQGTFHGMVFQDSDLAKWLEAVAYALQTRPDPELEALADQAVALVGRSQQPDGYLNTYFTVKEPGSRFTNLRDSHELYCAGHMMEAAVAYWEATGKKALMDIMMRMAHCIDANIGPEAGKIHGYPGHEEIELALLRMYDASGEAFLLRLAGYFLHERGTRPDFFVEEEKKRSPYAQKDHYDPSYYQNHMPPVLQERFAGHAVRALYLATGMAGYVLHTGETNMLDACKRMLDNLLQKQIYITGGVGSNAEKESFTYDYDLPGDRAYTETCASIALCFFARAMLDLQPSGRYADAMERALYNTCLAGMSLDGQHFFYVNPLEVFPDDCRRRADLSHVLPVRPRWFKCACCPPNLVRLLLSLGKYAYGSLKDTVYVHLYINGSAAVHYAGGVARIRVNTAYPHDGAIEIVPSAGEYTLALRIPAWAESQWELSAKDVQEVQGIMHDGYLLVRRRWTGAERLMLTLPVHPRRTYANSRLRAVNGKVCIERGPLVYCLEQADNGPNLGALILPDEAPIHDSVDTETLDGTVAVTAEGLRESDEEAEPLYSASRAPKRTQQLTFIPYYVWANRGENEMRVWVRSQEH